MPSSSDQLAARVNSIANDWAEQLRAIANTVDSDDLPDQQQLNRQVASAMDDGLQRLAETELWGRDNFLLSQRIWSMVGELLTPGSLQLRAREKPLGYAGDYVLLDRICNVDRHGTSMAWAFDEYFQQHAAPIAVRNRALLLSQAGVEFVQSVDDIVQITSFGSGPAFELYLLSQALNDADRQRLRLTLIDIDPHALEFASARLSKHLSAEQIDTQRANLARLPDHRARTKIVPTSDIIFSAGFFDYLHHDDAVKTIRFLWERLSSRGKLFVFNFGEHNPSRAYMEWVANWYLIYRDREQMDRLAQDSGLPAGSWTSNIESVGVNRFLRASRSRS